MPEDLEPRHRRPCSPARCCASHSEPLHERAVTCTIHGRAPAAAGSTIAVTSGKGGVGKTTLTVNVAVALAQLGQRVGMLDADFGLGNVDVMLGLTPMAHIGAVLAGEKALGEIGATAVAGVQVFPAGNGIRALTALPGGQWARLAGIVRPERDARLPARRHRPRHRRQRH